MTFFMELILDIDQLDAYTTFGVNISKGSAVRVQTNRRTDRQKDRTDSITSTADTGGNNCSDAGDIIRPEFNVPAIL